jgi:hypothetical protein
MKARSDSGAPPIHPVDKTRRSAKKHLLPNAQYGRNNLLVHFPGIV